MSQNDQTETSKLLSGLIGPTLVAVSASLMLNVASLPALVEQASHDPALILTSGIMIFVAGLAIVRAHNRWCGGWPVIVTILGWLFLLGGLARTLFPLQLAAMATEVGQSYGLIVGEAVVFLGLGSFLSFKAYGQR